MKNIRFLRVVMLLISLFLCASYGYATTEQKNEKIEEPQKIIRIVVEQSYSDKTYSPVEGINLPFESIAQKLLEYADLKVAHPESENYNLTLKIQAKGEALGTEYSTFGFGKGTYYYTGASLEGKISLELSGIPIHEMSFFGKISPPGRIDRSQMSSSPSSAPFKDTLWQTNSFGPVIIKLIEEISSPKFLINAMKDEDSNVREFSNRRFLYGLGEEAVDPLISFLKEEDSFILLKVVTALGNIKDPRAIEPLIGVLKDKDSEVRESAVVALKRFGETAVEPLISALQAEDLEVRRSVIKILGQLKDSRAVESLIVALKDEDAEVRKSAVDALGPIKDSRAVEPLIMALKYEDSKVRENVVKAIKEIGEAAVDTLIKTLQSEDFDIRVLAAWVLGQIGDSRATDPLIAALQDKEFFVQAKAAEALGEIQDSRAIEPLIEIMKSENILVKKHTADALKKITEQSFGMDYKAWSKWWKEHKE